ncbi:MAG: HAMP domain-containing protein, partial [Spirulina sp. SIO3F2]|nr:HAMP domain-containing protein [Spirulina sp. SIO3F2]
MKRFAFPIGFKIFGVASSMLALLLAVAYVNHRNISLVNRELIDLAHYFTKLTEDVAKINIHALEQEIHYERVVRLLETEPVDQALVAKELQEFEERGEQVDAELEQAIARAETATQNAYRTEDAIEFARIHPLLEVLETEHQNFHDQSLAVIKLFQAGDTTQAEILDRQIERLEADFDAHIQAVLFELGDATEAAAQSAAVHERQALRLSWMLAAVATGVGLSFAGLVTMGLVRPIRQLVESTQAIEQGDFHEVPVVSQDEVGRLSVAFNTMVTDIQAKESLKATFGQYVDPRVVERLINESGAALATQRQEMTVFFSDMAGFSTISELLTPTKLVMLINQYLTLAAEPILTHDGMIDQLIGAAAMEFSRPPIVSEMEHAKRACW